MKYSNTPILKPIQENPLFHTPALELLYQKIHLDNLFRLGVSCVSLSVALLLWLMHDIQSIRPLIILFCIYNIPYLMAWALLSKKRGLRGIDLFLNAFDILAISLTVFFSGGATSPFFYLYIIPFLVQAFHFDQQMVIWDGLLSMVACTITLWHHPETHHGIYTGAYIGQLFFLSIAFLTAWITVHLLRLKDHRFQRGVAELEATVTFLSLLNGASMHVSSKEFQNDIVRILNTLLKPFHIHTRFWMADNAWKMLQGVGEHPALRPGSPTNLPMTGCPAFALRRKFSYQNNQDAPCPTEQFNYTSHICLPVSSDIEQYGVLFIGTYAKNPWDAQDHHFFETITQAIALTLQRKSLFEKLQDKIGELHFSFEVGSSSLATFLGSTHSIDETTIRMLDGVLSILRVDRATLMLWDPATQTLQTRWVRGGDFKIQSPMQLQWGEGMAGRALQIAEPYWAEYATSDPHYVASAQTIKSLLCVPVYTQEGKPLGVINAVTLKTPRTFREREIAFLKTFGQQAALAIENARLHHKDKQNIEQLKELDKMKSQFLSLVSHDLRGPLTGIRGFCEILKERSLSTDQSELLKALETQVDLQERMVDDLLDLARMEKGQLSIHPVPCDLIQLIKEELDKSQMEARQHSIALTFLPSSTKTLPLVLADPDRIRQVLWNLIHNALKFTPEEGCVQVSACLVNNQALVEITDTGVGLPQEAQHRIFDKFFQVSPGGSRGSQGLGLGLAICKEIILCHHGIIEAQSRGIGKGTTMRFSLPIAKLSSFQSSSSTSLAA